MTRRRLHHLAAFLLGGAILNVAVAWACCQRALANYIMSGLPQPNATDIKWWKTTPVASFTPFQAGSNLVFGCKVRVIYGSGPLVNLPSGKSEITSSAWRCSAGFPMFAARGKRYGIPDATSAKWTHEYDGAIGLEKSAILWNLFPSRLVFLPLQPIWPGFAINTIFYAAILWLLFTGPGRIRRIIRRRRGLCPHCAYPVGTNDVCTECGEPVRAQNR